VQTLPNLHFETREEAQIVTAETQPEEIDIESENT
jgi:hypothetical protein